MMSHTGSKSKQGTISKFFLPKSSHREKDTVEEESPTVVSRPAGGRQVVILLFTIGRISEENVVQLILSLVNPINNRGSGGVVDCWSNTHLVLVTPHI